MDLKKLEANMSKAINEYNVIDLREWHPLKKLARAVIDAAIISLTNGVDWLNNFENQEHEYKIKHKELRDIKTWEINRVYYFLTSANVDILSNNETSSIALCEKINIALLKKYDRKFLLKYLRMIEYI